MARRKGMDLHPCHLQRSGLRSCRTTIISGLHPPSTGSEHMRSMTRLPADFKMYPAYLRELGYYCTNKFEGRLQPHERG